MLEPRNFSMTMVTIVIWAAAFPLIKVALDEVAPITMALVRFAVASVFFLAVLFRPIEIRRTFSRSRRWLGSGSLAPLGERSSKRTAAVCHRASAGITEAGVR